jgi:23S rRNA pseudouridine2605 synthase
VKKKESNKKTSPFPPKKAYKKPFMVEKAEMDQKEKDLTEGIRLNKFIANAGICARRKADELIVNGEVTVNGEVINEMGYKVLPKDIVKYKGQRVISEKKVYFLFNKPKDCITTTEDENGRRTVMDYIKEAKELRIYPIGRLDRNTTGLLVLTNDGELAQKLSHPSSNISKLYHVELDKKLTIPHYEEIVKGLTLEDGLVKVDGLEYEDNSKMNIGIEIHVGKNRIVRRIFEHLGYEVIKLDRVIYAGLTKKDLPRGKYRPLSEKEVVFLKYYLGKPTK